MKKSRSEAVGRHLFAQCFIKQQVFRVTFSTVFLCATVIPVFASVPGRVSGSIGIGPVYGFTMSHLVIPDFWNSESSFPWTHPRYHMAFGADISATYMLSKRWSASLRNVSDWYRPGFSMIVSDELSLNGAYTFSDASAGFYAGCGVGINFYLFPFDKYWNDNYGGIGPSVNILIGYKVSDRYRITLENSTNIPQSKKESITVADPPVYAHTEYLVNHIRLLIHFILF